MSGEADENVKPSARSSASSGRKSRNLRQATQHLREEALRRYRRAHQGDDPPPDWEPSPDEQDDIIRALSPPGAWDPHLVAAQNDGAFENLGTPRGIISLANQTTPTIIYQSLEEFVPQDEAPIKLNPPKLMSDTSSPSVNSEQRFIHYLKPVDSYLLTDRRPEPVAPRPIISTSCKGIAVTVL